MTVRAVRRLFRKPQRGRVSAKQPEPGQNEPLEAERQTARLAALATGLGRLGHDLRGVLAPALLAAERLQAHSDPAVRRSADVLVRAVDRASETLRESLSALRDGLPTARREPVVLDAAIAAAARADLPCSGGVPARAVVQADPAYLPQAWRSLFAALRSLGASRVTLEGRSEAGAWTVACVHDAAPPGTDDGAAAALPAFLMARDLIRACGGDLVERDATTLVAIFVRG